MNEEKSFTIKPEPRPGVRSIKPFEDIENPTLSELKQQINMVEMQLQNALQKLGSNSNPDMVHSLKITSEKRVNEIKAQIEKLLGGSKS